MGCIVVEYAVVMVDCQIIESRIEVLLYSLLS